MYFDKNGQPIDRVKFCELFEDVGYRVVEITRFPDGSRISTVWLGINHAFGGGEPVLFETMDFPAQEIQYRYHTEAEARMGHAAAVEEHLAAHPELRN